MKRSGYTLIELVTVVLILGILAGVALPRVMGGSDEAAIEATISHLKTITLAAELYYNETGDWPPNALSETMPVGMSPYLRPNIFAVACPAGGIYDWDQGNAGFAANIKIVDEAPDLTTWSAIDRRMDDGDSTSGRLTRLPTGRRRWVWVIDY